MGPGCTSRVSSYVPIPVVPPENSYKWEAGLPAEQAGCGWVAVDETVRTRLFGLTLKQDSRQFERSLFYCCPGATDPDPRCYQTDWFHRSE